MPPASCFTAKLTTLGAQLWLVSGCGQHAKFQVEDIILIMHSAPASNSQRLGSADLHLSSMDLTLAAVSLTVHSAGMLIALDSAKLPYCYERLLLLCYTLLLLVAELYYSWSTRIT